MRRALLILFLPPLLWADCDVTAALLSLRPGAQWSVSGDDYKNLVWLSTQTIPTKAEVIAEMQACRTDATARQALRIQARQDVKNNLLTAGQRLQALLILLDMDR